MNNPQTPEEAFDSQNEGEPTSAYVNQDPPEPEEAYTPEVEARLEEEAQVEPEPISIVSKMLLDAEKYYNAKVEDILALSKYEELLKDVAQLYGGEVTERMWYNAISYHVHVKSFKEKNLSDILEHLDTLGYPVIDTNDQTYGNGGRLFRIAKGVYVFAELDEGTDACKKVIVGWSAPTAPSPIYEFQCKEDVK